MFSSGHILLHRTSRPAVVRRASTASFSAIGIGPRNSTTDPGAVIGAILPKGIDWICVHCVVARVVERFRRDRSEHRLSYQALPGFGLVPVNPVRLYRAVWRLLTDATKDLPSPCSIRIRTIAGARPEITILVVAVSPAGSRIRGLLVPRQLDENLSGGFTEALGEQLL
jgi:hypothetical protein